MITQRTHTVGVSIFVQLVSGLTGLESVPTYKKQHIFLFGQIQFSQTGDQPFREPSPYGKWFP